MYCTADITSTYHKNAGLEAASELLSHTLGHTVTRYRVASPAVRRIDLFDPRQNEHHFAPVVCVDLVWVCCIGPDGVVFKVDRLQGLQRL